MGVENLDFQEEPIKGVEKLKDGSVKLSYSKETSMGMLNYTFNIKKLENGKCYITNQTPDTPENKGYLHNQNTRYEINLATFDDFFKSLGKALDGYIGRPRPSLSEQKGEQAYLLLGGRRESVKLNQQKNKEIKKQKKETNRVLEWLKDRWLRH